MFCGTGSIGNAFPVNSKPPAPSCAKSHQNSTPVQEYATCLCLPKSKAKENGHCQIKILPRLWTTIWQRKAVWKTLFQNKSSGTINPVYLPQTTPEQYKERVDQKKKRCLSQILPNIFILHLWRNIPLTIMTLIVFCLEIMQWKENASTLTQHLERHLLELTLEPNHETWLKKAQLLICTVLPQLPNPNGCSSYWRSRFALRTWQGRNRNNKKCVLN